MADFTGRQYRTTYDKYGANQSQLPAQLFTFPWQRRQIPNVIGVGTCYCQILLEILIAAASSAIKSSTAIVSVREPCSDIIMPCVQMAFHRSRSLDAPPRDNAALPEWIATPENDEPLEKDLTPEDAALPDSSDLPHDYSNATKPLPTFPQIQHPGSIPWKYSTILHLTRVCHCRRGHR